MLIEQILRWTTLIIKKSLKPLSTNLLANHFKLNGSRNVQVDFRGEGMKKRQLKIKSCESQIQSTVEIPINDSWCFIKLLLRVVVGVGAQGAGRGGLSTHSERVRFVFICLLGPAPPPLQGIEHRTLALGLYLEILTLNVLESRVLIGFLFFGTTAAQKCAAYVIKTQELHAHVHVRI